MLMLALDGVAVDRGQLVGVEVQVLQRGDVLLELGHAAGADQRRGDPRVAQHPGQRQLGQGLAAAAAISFSARTRVDVLLGEQVLGERLAAAHRESSGMPLR